MTVNRLHKILSEEIKAGRGRFKVCVSKDTFRHNLELDGCTILDVWGAEAQIVPLIDDDGGAAYRKDWTERHFRAFVMLGTSYEPRETSR